MRIMLTIFFDGLCEPKNPGGMGAFGFVIYRDNYLIKKDYGVVGRGKGITNNVAEYSALKASIEWLNENHPDEKKITVKGDSKLVINQMAGRWRIKSVTSKRFVPQIRDLLGERDVTYQWVPRENNTEADALSRKAYEEECKRLGIEARYMKKWSDKYAY